MNRPTEQEEADLREARRKHEQDHPPLCKTCRWFRNDYHECHLQPPVVIVSTQGEPQHISVYPEVGGADWCGQHTEQQHQQETPEDLL